MQAHLDERAALAEDIKQLCYAFLDVSCNRSAMESLFYKVYCAFGIDLFSEIIEIGSELDEECYCLERMFKMLLEGNERIEALEMGGAPDTEIQKVLRFYSIEQQEAREMEVNKPILEWLQEKRIKVHKSLEVYKVQSVGEMLRMMVVYKCLPKDQVRLRAYLLEGDVEKQIEFKGNIPLFIEEQMDELANDLDGSTKMKLLWWD